MRRIIKRTVKVTSVLIILIILALILYGLTNIGTINEEASILINTYGAPALFIVATFLEMIPLLVSSIVALGAALIAGVNTYFAISAVVLGSIIGSTIGFAIGKKYMFEAVDILTSKKATNRLTQLTNDYGKIIVPIAAISPLPYMPIVLGAINFSKRNFIIFGLIPRAIAIIVYGLLFSLL